MLRTLLDRTISGAKCASDRPLSVQLAGFAACAGEPVGYDLFVPDERAVEISLTDLERAITAVPFL
jgi:hypothetical protein